MATTINGINNYHNQPPINGQMIEPPLKFDQKISAEVALLHFEEIIQEFYLSEKVLESANGKSLGSLAPAPNNADSSDEARDIIEVIDNAKTNATDKIKEIWDTHQSAIAQIVDKLPQIYRRNKAEYDEAVRLLVDIETQTHKALKDFFKEEETKLKDRYFVGDIAKEIKDNNGTVVYDSAAVEKHYKQVAEYQKRLAHQLIYEEFVTGLDKEYKKRLRENFLHGENIVAAMIYAKERKEAIERAGKHSSTRLEDCSLDAKADNNLQHPLMKKRDDSSEQRYFTVHTDNGTVYGKANIHETADGGWELGFSFPDGTITNSQRDAIRDFIKFAKTKGCKTFDLADLLKIGLNQADINSIIQEIYNWVPDATITGVLLPPDVQQMQQQGRTNLDNLLHQNGFHDAQDVPEIDAIPAPDYVPELAPIAGGIHALPPDATIQARITDAEQKRDEAHNILTQARADHAAAAVGTPQIAAQAAVDAAQRAYDAALEALAKEVAVQNAAPADKPRCERERDDAITVRDQAFADRGIAIEQAGHVARIQIELDAAETVLGDATHDVRNAENHVRLAVPGSSIHAAEQAALNAAQLVETEAQAVVAALTNLQNAAPADRAPLELERDETIARRRAALDDYIDKEQAAHVARKQLDVDEAQHEYNKLFDMIRPTMDRRDREVVGSPIRDAEEEALVALRDAVSKAQAVINAQIALQQAVVAERTAKDLDLTNAKAARTTAVNRYDTLEQAAYAIRVDVQSKLDDAQDNFQNIDNTIINITHERNAALGNRPVYNAKQRALDAAEIVRDRAQEVRNCCVALQTAKRIADPGEEDRIKKEQNYHEALARYTTAFDVCSIAMEQAQHVAHIQPHVEAAQVAVTDADNAVTNDTRARNGAAAGPARDKAQRILDAATIVRQHAEDVWNCQIALRDAAIDDRPDCQRRLDDTTDLYNQAIAAKQALVAAPADPRVVVRTRSIPGSPVSLPPGMLSAASGSSSSSSDAAGKVSKDDSDSSLSKRPGHARRPSF